MSDESTASTSLAGLLRNLVDELRPGAGGAPRDPPATGRYEIGEVLGRGGMGIVYRARDTLLGRSVALKILRHDEPAASARFLREARAQASIEHDQICRIYEVGEAGGVPFIVMQLIAGRTLGAAAPEMTLEQRVKVLREVADALHAAHRVGLIHRDVKPSNILVERGEDGRFKPYVVDFGLAMSGEDVRLTQTGMPLGTPLYMAPEQARGDSRAIDRRTDVYAIGATAYEILSGAAPFSGRSSAEILVQVLSEDPVPLRRHNAALPRDVEAIVMRCLEKRPDDRYGSARDVAEDFQRFLDGEPVQARRAGIARRVWKRLRRHWLIGAVLGIAFLAAVVAAAWALHESAGARARAAAAQRFGERVRQIENLMRISHMLPLHDTRREKEVLRVELGAIAAQMAQEGESVAGPGHYALGRGHLALEDYPEARRHLTRAWEIGYRTTDVELALGRTLSELYRAALERAERLPGRRKDEAVAQAERDYRDPALQHLRQGRGALVEPAALVDALIAFHEKRYAQVQRSAQEARARAPWLYEAHLLEADALAMVADGHLWAGRYAEAERAFQASGDLFAQAARIAESDARVHERDCWRGKQLLHLHLFRGQAIADLAEAAIAACQRAREAAPGRSAPESLILGILGLTAEDLLARSEDPRPVVARLWAAGEALLQRPGDRFYVHKDMGYATLAAALYELSEALDPRASVARSLAAFGRAKGEHPRYSATWSGEGEAYMVLAQYEPSRAEHWWRAALGAFDRALALDPHSYYALVYRARANHGLARVRLERGEEAEVEAELRALDADCRKAIELNPKYHDIYTALGMGARARAALLARRGRDPRPALEEALAHFARGAELNPGRSEALVLASRIWLERKAGGAGEALRLLERARKISPRWSEVHFTLGEAWRAAAAAAKGSGEAARARAAAAEVYREALRLNPRRADALRALAKVR